MQERIHYVGGVEFVYEGHAVPEAGPSAPVETAYTTARRPVAGIALELIHANGINQLRFQHVDHLGSIVAYSDAFGDVEARMSFDADAPLIVEIGFGNGEALALMAASEPQHNFLGIEVHEPGVGSLVQQLVRQELSNVRVAMRDAIEVLESQIPPASLAQVRIYFPDPWPKKRHHKRRLIQPLFIAQIATRVQPGGLLHLATDWAPYADWMREVIAGCGEFRNLGDPWVDRPAWRPETRFERRGLKRGHEIFDLLYERVAH